MAARFLLGKGCYIFRVCDGRRGCAAWLVSTVLLLAFLALPSSGVAQARGDGDDERERQFVEALRREDLADAERWVALRDARGRALAELRQAEAQYAAAGTELRSIALPRLTQAQRTYAETSLAVLDFLDTRDHRALTGYQDAIKRINGFLEERQQTRAELERLLR